MSGKRVGVGWRATREQIRLDGPLSEHAQQGWDQGIRVTAICPSWVNTGMARAVTAVEPAAMTQPDDLPPSPAICWSCECCRSL